MTAETAYYTLSKSYVLTDDDVTEYRWAITNRKEYANHVMYEAMVVHESIKLGQSTIAMGEMMRLLFNATHKLVNGHELDLPGVEHFSGVAASSHEAICYINNIESVAEEYAGCAISCGESVDCSYV